MARFLDCPACSCLVRSEEAACPFCGARVRPHEASRSLRFGLVLGLMTASCVGGDEPTDGDIPPTGLSYAAPATITVDGSEEG